jgi:hypothetical protein
VFLEPSNTDVFLQTAKFLYHIDKYAEAFEMIRESIEIIKPAKVPHDHHQTLAKILAAYGESDSTINLEYSMNIGAEDPDILFDEIEKRTALLNQSFESVNKSKLIYGVIAFLLFMFIIKFIKNYLKQEREEEEAMRINNVDSLEKSSYETFETAFISKNNENTQNDSFSSSDLDLCVKMDKRKNASTIFVFNSIKNSKTKRM